MRKSRIDHVADGILLVIFTLAVNIVVFGGAVGTYASRKHHKQGVLLDTAGWILVCLVLVISITTLMQRIFLAKANLP